MKNDLLRKQQERLKDKLMQSNFSYWSAILTVNGLILAFFSSDILNKKIVLAPFTILLLLLTVISIGLTLYNFREVRDLYSNLGSTTREKFKKMSKEEKNQAHEKNISRFKWRKRREATLEIILMIEGIMILIMVVYSKYFLN